MQGQPVKTQAGSRPGRTSPNESLSVSVVCLTALVVYYLTASVFNFCCGSSVDACRAAGSLKTTKSVKSEQPSTPVDRTLATLNSAAATIIMMLVDKPVPASVSAFHCSSLIRPGATLPIVHSSQPCVVSNLGSLSRRAL